MKLLLIRHGIAMDQEEFAGTGQSDDLRPLTSDGMKKMKRVARGLRDEVAKLDHLATSPLTRAGQTAEIVANEYGLEDPEITGTLAPGVALEEFETWAAVHADKDVLAVVGHEPHLSSLATWLLANRDESRIELKKGGACLIEFESEPRRGAGILLWLLTPRQLRGMGR
jgi:phosphohistidine phosphatase